MKPSFLSGAFVLLVAGSTALGGEIFGKVVKGGAPVSAGAASIEVKCGDATYPAVQTDKSGSYHLVAERSGKCVLTVKHEGQAASLDVASYDEAVQIDLVLEVKDGKLTVRRK
jgi:hypothetical protein